MKQASAANKAAKCYFQISTHTDPAYDGYFQVKASLVQRDAEDERPSTMSGPLCGLRVTSQGDNSDSTTRHLYAWSLCAGGHWDVDLGRAAAITKALKPVERAMTKHAKRFGRAETFAAYVLRVGDALGVAGYVTQTPDGWRWMTAEDAHYHLTYVERQWREAGLKVSA